MSKLWRAVSAVAIICLVVGILGVGLGFFMGSSPSVIDSHGTLAEYLRRLEMNWGFFREDVGSLLAWIGLSL